MRKIAFQDSFQSLELLERKLSLSSLAFSSSSGRVQTVPGVVRPLDDDPPPDPEPPPVVNPISGPITYPSLPPSGPLGPG
jgi:hypothetical protein